tara:strand:+ start:271 stop:480 length:210 start_codon:yes stop_codon:yes gene_type:complete
MSGTTPENRRLAKGNCYQLAPWFKFIGASSYFTPILLHPVGNLLSAPLALPGCIKASLQQSLPFSFFKQ